ncbi:MAG TPA: hypothetical protein VF322_06615, partial [Gammaproteobacteria bacterium]
TPTVVISLMSSPSLVQIDATHAILALDAERFTPFQGRGTPLYSVAADRDTQPHARRKRVIHYALAPRWTAQRAAAELRR